jgi:Cys-rich repeat protein
MLRKLLASVAVVIGAGVAWMAPLTPISEAQAAPAECKTDADCASGTFCILALTPHVCKPPQAAGASCKRDVVCESKKCDIPTGKEVGVCK